MTLTQYLRVLRQHWLIVATLAILGVAAAAGYTSRQTPVYQAQTQVFVSAQDPRGGGSLSQLSESSTFSQQRVKSYASMATSSAVTETVVKDLRLPYTPAQLARQIDAGPRLDTVLIDLTVSDPDPERATAIAAAITARLQTVVDDLETVNGGGTSTVKLTVTRAPEVPTEPVSPRVPLNIALGLLLGLGLGIGAAVLRDQLNTTLRGVNEVEELTGSVPLGVVPFDANTPKQPLVTADAFGGRAEAFRALRTNLQFADVDHPPRVIAVTSALPGEGKTTTACNIALTLAQSGARVVLVEGDLRKPAVGSYLGISNAVGLTNVLAGQHDLREVMVGYERDLLAVLPSGPNPPNPSELLGSQQMRYLLDTLAEHYDVVVVDAPPLLPVTDAALISAAADGAILVIRHSRSRREEADRALQSLAAVNAKLLGTVLNFAPRKGRDGYSGYGYGYGQPPGQDSPGAHDTVEPNDSTERRRNRGRRNRPQPVATESHNITLPDAGGGRAAAVDGRLLTEPSVHRVRPDDGPNSTASSGLPTGAPAPSVGPAPTGAPRPTADGRTHADDRGPAWSPSSPGAAGGTRAHRSGPPGPTAWAQDVGRAPAPDPSTGGAAERQARRADSGAGLRSAPESGPLTMTSPDEGPALITRADGLELTRTAQAPVGGTTGAPVVGPRTPDRLEVHHAPIEDVPQELRLHPLPPESATDRPTADRHTPAEDRRRGADWTGPDTAPSGIPVVTGPAERVSPQDRTMSSPPAPAVPGPEPVQPVAPDPLRADQAAPGTESWAPAAHAQDRLSTGDGMSTDPDGPPSAWSRVAWFDPVGPEEASRPPGRTSDAAADPEDIPPLLVDLSAPDLDLLEDERELLIPPQSVLPHLPGNGTPRHHRSRRSL